MRDLVINKQLSWIQKYNNYDDENLSIIKYGLESIYILITKSIVVFFVSYLLGLICETLLFLLFYNCIRATAFGLHATKSWICLVSSICIFILLPFLSKVIIVPFIFKLIFSLIGIIFICKNAPADTYKRPIVSPKRRLVLKIISTFISISMCICSLIISNNFISNALIFSVLLECLLISPTVYKFFKLPYDNYKRFIN